MTVAFFDLDKTLLAVNSATLWVRHELKHKNLKLSQALRAMGWLIRYRLGDADLEAPVRYSISTLKGKDPVAMAARMRAFYQADLRYRFRPGALEAIERHRRAGDRIVLLSSTIEFLAAAVSEDIAFDAILCTRFEMDEQGRFSGRPLEPLCFGAGKLMQAQALADKWQVSLRDCVFYSDSNADLPMFAAVGQPVAVNPDPQLRRHARRLGWQRLDWGRPVPHKRKKKRSRAGGDADSTPTAAAQQTKATQPKA